jgi:hypothetical protein
MASLPENFISGIPGSAGTVVDPITAQTQRFVNNKQIQKNAAPWGNPIPISLGARSCPGKLIWASNIRQVPTPEAFNTLPYFEVDLAISFGFAGAPPDERSATKLIRLWAQSKLCYDIDDDSRAAAFHNMVVRFHPGLIDASPDADISAAMGDLTPSFRSQMYVVIKNFPLWLFGLREDLPDEWTAEIFDITAGGPSITPYTMSPVSNLHTQSPLFIDFNQGGRFAFYQDADDKHGIVWTKDPMKFPDLEENGRRLITGLSFETLQPHVLAIHDPQWGTVLTVDQTSNSSPLHLIDLRMGMVVSSIGKFSTNLLEDKIAYTSFGTPDNENDEITFKTSGDIVKAMTRRAIISGYVLGGIFDTLGVLEVRPYVNTMRMMSATNLGGDFGLLGSENIRDIVTYPIIGRPDLAVADLADANGFTVHAIVEQDAFVYVARGTYVTRVRLTATTDYDHHDGTILGEAGGFYNLVPTEAFNVLQIPGASIDALFMDPSDWNLVVFWHPIDNTATMHMAKYKVTLVDWSDGQKQPIVGDVLWSKLLEDFYFASENRWSMRESAFSYFGDKPLAGLGGTFGYEGGNNFVELDLSTGEVLHQTPIIRSGRDGWTYNPRQGTVEIINSSSDIIEHIRLRATLPVKIPLPNVISAFMQSAGYATDDFVIDSNIDDTVWGGLMDQSADLWGTMRNIGTVYDFAFFITGATVTFRRSPQSSDAPLYSISLDNLYSPDDEKHEVLTTVFAAPGEQAGNVALTYIDRNQHYVGNTQSFHRSAFPVSIAIINNDSTVPIPIVMEAGEALRRSAVATYSAYVQGTVQSLKLPLAYARVEPGDLINVYGPRFSYDILVGETVLDVDWTLSITGTTHAVRASDGFRVGPDGEWLGGGSAPFTADPTLPVDLPTSSSDCIAVAMDVPLLRIADAISNLYISIYTGAAGTDTTFTGANVSTRIASGPWELFFHATKSIPQGVATAALPATSFPFQTDNDTVLTITPLNFDPTLITSAADDADFLAGANAMLIGAEGTWELVFFGNASVVNGRVLVSRLLRGRRGTELNCGSHAASDRINFVRLQGITQGLVPLSTGFADIDSILHVRARADGFTGNLNETPITLQGNSLKPWAPTSFKTVLGSHINATPAPDYFNTGGGGTTGNLQPDRSDLITVTGNFTPQDGVLQNLVNGLETNGPVGSMTFATGLTNVQMTFDFHGIGMPQIITAIKWGQDLSASQGTYDVKASNDLVSWVTLASGITLAAPAGPNPTENTWSNSTAFWYYRLDQVGGSTSHTPDCHEIWFKTMAGLAANDLFISWLRRDRLGEEFVTNPQPMREATEEYDIEILSGGIIVRTVAGLTSPNYIYTATDQATDGFTPPLANLSVKVYQVSASVGRGYVGAATINVT